MSNVFDLFDIQKNPVLNALRDGTAFAPGDWLKEVTRQFGEIKTAGEMQMRGGSGYLDTIARTYGARTSETLESLAEVAERLGERQAAGDLAQDWQSYLADAGERTAIMFDILRERGDNYLEHEAAGCPPVLTYDYEIVMEGADLTPPSNYVLLRIIPPEWVIVHDWKRPYIIIDPRAGHGAGIGGFKADSQVGVALRDGHPVYFVSFRRDPEPGQTIAAVTRTEAEFVREVMRRHPDASKPVITGNCQGGWATLLLAATNPDITGPVCLNGAPVATWSGRVGRDPMRYNGGVLGGAWQPMFWSDLGGGVFDGAHLVQNFELLNPGRTLFRKYYDVFANPEETRERFLEFERWWGGFFLLNEAEIRWITEQLFVGNRLVRNEARLEPGRTVDVKNIRAPVIVFASHGDNITPPQQALNWIVDSYSDVSEIQIHGQRIIYLVHDQIGHLGIFVSSKIAKKEHAEVTSTLKTIEALPPGLYEMKIDDYAGDIENRTFMVSFHERTLDDIRALDDGREDERPFAAVARASEIQAEAYDILVRPFIQAAVTPQVAEMSRALHPLRAQRAAWSSRNPAAAAASKTAKGIAETRKPLGEDNPFVMAERAWAGMVEQSLDYMRDVRDACYENLFFSIWSTPWARWFGRDLSAHRALSDPIELKMLPAVQAALRHVDQGGFVEAVIRMLILLAESRGNVRRDRLERSARVLNRDEPFCSLSADERKMVIHEQTLIVRFDRERAIETLPDLLPTPAERELASRVVRYIPGAIDEMAPHTIEMIQRFQRVLDLPAVTEDITEDPLADADTVRQRTGVAAA